MRYSLYALCVLLVVGAAVMIRPGGAKGADGISANTVAASPTVGSQVLVQVDIHGDVNGKIMEAEGKLLSVNDSWIAVQDKLGINYFAREKVSVVLVKP